MSVCRIKIRMNACRSSYRSDDDAISSRSAATIEFGMAPQERSHDQTDQLLISESGEAGNEAEIGMLRIETGERIDFDELRIAFWIAPDVDAATIATAQCAPRPHGDIGRTTGLCIVDQAVGDVVVAAFLVLEAVINTRSFVRGDDLHHPERAGFIPGPDDADGELAAGQIGLDQ